jgi:hypothetical protein
LLTYAKLTAKEYADTFDKPTKAQLSEWQNSTFADWANESLVLNERIYDFGFSEGEKVISLGQWYQDKNKPVAGQRLHQAGIRLAFFLNKIFSD